MKEYLDGWRKASAIVAISVGLTTLVWQASVEFIERSVQAYAADLDKQSRRYVLDAIAKHERPEGSKCWHNCLDKTIGAQSADIEQIQQDIMENQKTLNALYNSLGRVSGKLDVLLDQSKAAPVRP